MAVDWIKLAAEAELGKRVLVYLNYLAIRQQEDREYVEQVKRVAGELREGMALGCGKSKRAAA